MKSTRLLFACGGGLTLALALLMALNSNTATAAPTATTRYVLGDGGTDTSDCADPDAPCETIQHALAQANSEDTIRVAYKYSPAVYSGGLVVTKSITLEGGWRAIPGVSPGFTWERATPCEPSRTTIDAAGAGRVISITGGITPTIDCFIITGGDATGLGGGLYGNDAGGGICSRDASPLIVNNVITANYGCTGTCTGGGGGYGGGIYMLNAPATAVISNNTVAYNVGDGPGGPISGRGGGIMLRNSNALVASNTIEHNFAGDAGGLGGGIAIFDGSPTIADNDILSNEAGQAIVCVGGGVYVQSSTPVTIERNLFQYNMAMNGTSPGSVSRGGGLHYTGVSGASALIRDNVFRWNYAAPASPQVSEGGGMYLTGLSTPSLVSGNTIQGNYANWNEDGNGGGIYVDQSEVVIEDNDIFGNKATWLGDHGEGGGLYIDGGTVLIQRNVITDNYGVGFAISGTPTGYGGGMAILSSQAVVQSNWIADNVGTNGRGGGVYITGSLGIVLSDNTIHDNTADYGGGACLELSDGAELTGNRVFSNTATYSGGGLHLSNSDGATLARNTLYRNMAASGGGMYLYGEGGSTWELTLANNVVAENRVSVAGPGMPGVYIKGVEARLLHTTIARNSGGDGTGVYVTSGSAAMTNTILVSQTVGIYVSSDSAATLRATLWGDGAWANGTDWAGPGTIITSTPNLWQEPGFVAPASGDYHIRSDSPAVDAGVDAGVSDDIDAESRPYGAAPDLGADEASCLARVVGGGTYYSIQEAVGAATSGQTVQVAAGVCRENVAITETVTLEGGWDTAFTSRSADPASATTIDASGAGRVISITGYIAPTVDGFTLTGGDATGLGGSTQGYDVGGGLYSYLANTIVSNCIITGNVASRSIIGWGGGAGFLGGTVTLEDSRLQGNVASTASSSGYGGGAYFRGVSSTVSGNTVQDNTASEGGYGYGGGLCFMYGNATLQDNVVQGNSANTAYLSYGGGIEVRQGSASLHGDTIRDNAANTSGTNGYGGGISVRQDSVVTLDEVELYGNRATFGGGIYLSDSANATLTGSAIHHNTAGMGGGLYLTLSPNATLSGNQIHNNTADYGAGAWIVSSLNASLTNNHVYDNTSYGLAGGLWLNGSDDATLSGNQVTNNTANTDGGGLLFLNCDNATLESNLVADNHIATSGEGAGIHIQTTSARLLHTTLARNRGGDGDGLYVAYTSTVAMTNTILVSHTVGITVSGDSTATLAYTLWGDGAWANGMDWAGSGTIFTGGVNMWQAPSFADPDGSDYHLGPGSPAIDAGVEAGVTSDMDGDPRPIGALPDIGADEAPQRVFLPLVLR